MSHYFDERPEVASSPKPIDVVLADLTFTYTSDRGVFGSDRLDPGTRILLRSAPPPADSGNVLDLGCGAGPIALTMAQRSPGAIVWAIDPNRRARELTAANAATLALNNLDVVAPDEVPPEVRFTTVWSNPPIRIGKTALHSLLATWLGRLTPDGTAVLVVHKHLGADSLQRWLTDQGFATSRLLSKAGYRLLECRYRHESTP